MKAICPDILVHGEGEEVTDNLITALSNGFPIKNVLGLGLIENGNLIRTGRQPAIADLDALPFPDYDGFEFEHYFNNHSDYVDSILVNPNLSKQKRAPIITGRDCPAKCTFCYRHMEGKFRSRSIDNVISEVKLLTGRYAANELIILDDLFSASKARVLEFCDKIKQFKISWGCQLRANVVDEELLAAMKQSGCNYISYGVESGSKKILKSMRKGLNLEQIERALMLTKEAKIAMQGILLFGDPAETEETIEESLDFYRKHKYDFSSSLSLVPIIPYPGTKLYNDLVEKNRIRDFERFYLTFKDHDGGIINMTSLNEKRFKKLISKQLPIEQKRNRLYGKVSRVGFITKASCECDVICPFCNQESKKIKLYILKDPLDVLSMSFHTACFNCFQRFSLYGYEVIGYPRSALWVLVAMVNSFKTKVFYSKLYRNIAVFVKSSKLLRPLVLPIVRRIMHKC